MKFLFVLVFTVLVTVSVGTIIKDFQKGDDDKLISPLVAGVSTNNSDPDYDGWQIFINNYFGYKIRHPSEINIKNNRNGDITLLKEKGISINISQNTLSGNETLNTVIESVINQKMAEGKSHFQLLKTITPIALSAVTAQTFTTDENGQYYTYYYIPQVQNKYLVIISKTISLNDSDFLTSEKIIYSLEVNL